MESSREDRSIEGIHTNFVNKLLLGQKQCIPYRTIKAHKIEPRWMANKLSITWVLIEKIIRI